MTSAKGTHKRAPKSPKLKHRLRREAEKVEVKDKSAILDPKGSVSEVFKNTQTEEE